VHVIGPDYDYFAKREKTNIEISKIGADKSPPVIMVSIYLGTNAIFDYALMEICSRCIVFNGLNCTSIFILIVQ